MTPSAEMNENDSGGGKPSRRIKWLLSRPWVFAVLMTLLGVLSVYVSTTAPSPRKLAAGAIFGAAVGIAYMLEVHSTTSTFASRFLCAVVGAIAGGVICLLLSISVAGVLFGVVTGGVLGATSRTWIGHLNLP